MGKIEDERSLEAFRVPHPRSKWPWVALSPSCLVLNLKLPVLFARQEETATDRSMTTSSI